MDDSNRCIMFLRALVNKPCSFDDTRLEQLFSAIVQHSTNALPPPQQESMTLLRAGVTQTDYRKVAVCVRLLGHWGGSSGADLSFLQAATLYRHQEPLVRHAMLYAARLSGSKALLSQCPWVELLFDDSIWVSGEAHAAFTRALVLDAVESRTLLLGALFSHAGPSHHDRALIALVGTLLREPLLRPLLSSYRLVSLLMERFVVAKSLDFECGAALSIFGQHQPEDRRLILTWFQACISAGMPQTAAMLAAYCHPELQEQMLPCLVQAAGAETALPLVKRMRPNDFEGVDVCLNVIQSKTALEKWQCLACSILQSWNYKVADEYVLLQLLAHSSNRPRLLRHALQLSSSHWNMSTKIHEALLHLARDDPQERWPLVWECVARHSITALAHPSIEAFCSEQLLPSDTKLCAWFSIIPFLGPKHGDATRIIRIALDERQPIEHIQTALQVLSKLEWGLLATDVVCKAVTRCINGTQDETDAVLAALGWMRTFPLRHPDAASLIQRTIIHTARSVRQTTWQLLVDCGRAWPTLEALCAEADSQVRLESALSVYGDPLEMLALNDDPMLERGEPDCCE